MILPPLNLDGPAAIAFSGGGDSTAMVHAFRDRPNITHAFIIDHALRGGSEIDAQDAAQIAKSYGYEVEIDRWAHHGIATGVQVKAREYRYAALGRMCRQAGIKHLVTAHTEDDQAETLLMRLDRQTGWRGLAGMPAAAYGPLWPSLGGVTLHRPWLHVSRQALREYNALNSLTFIDDPSNQNSDFARVRARQALAADPALRVDLLSQQKQMRSRLMEERQEHRKWLVDNARVSPQGFIETTSVPSPELLLHLINVVSGGGGPIDAAKRERLWRDMTKPDFKAATLGGAWILRKNRDDCSEADNMFVFLRDRVAVTGRETLSRLKPMVLEADRIALWDGRFFCRAKTADIRVEIGFGHLQILRQMPDFKTLFECPKEIRESLPVFFHKDKPVGFGACDTKFMVSRATSASRLQAL